MARSADSINEDTSNLGRDRERRQASAHDAPPRANPKSPDVGQRRRVPCADPDPTEGVARHDAPAVREHEREAIRPSGADTPRPATNGASAGTPGAGPAEGPSRNTPSDLPVIIDAKLHSVRRYVAGDVIAERFVIVDGLPASGMGQVYKALDRERDSTDALSSYVALKFGHVQADGTESSPSPIRREFDILSQLSHPNIVKAFEIGTHDGAEFIVMEWLEGKSLLHMLEEQTCKRMALRRAREIVRDVASGLACAHERGIVHGDIKPSNIFISRRGTAKLLDFGAVSPTREQPDGQSWATRAYASVDVLGGKLATRKDDIYSLGVTAYLLLSGERPFGTRDATAAKRENSKVPPLPQDAADMWPAVEAALSFDASKRPADAARFLAEFLRLSPAHDEPPGLPQFSYLQYAAIGALVIALAVFWAFRIDDLASLDTRATLHKARLALTEGRLIEPDGDSAMSYFNEVLAVSPEHPEARQGVDAIAGDFLTRAANSLAIEDYEAARSSLAIARRVSPDHASIPIVERLFDRHATDLVASASLIAGRNPAEAAGILDQVEQLTDSEAERIAEIRARMADAAVELELRMLYAGIDERILAERLAIPRGDSAIDLLNRARAIRPDDERLPLAANRIVSALLFQALFAISEGKFDKADDFIAAAKSLNVRHLAMARTVYELAKARDRVAAQAYEQALSSSSGDALTTAGAGNVATAADE